MSLVRKIKARITGITEYSGDVRLFRLEPSNQNFDFKCGQFLQLAVDEYDRSYPWPESRCFSILSSPTQKDFIDILVSRKGIFTNRMFSEIRPDDSVWIKLPYGDFNFDTLNDDELFLMAGGTGISPFISYFYFLLESETNNKVNLYYGVKESNLLIFTNLFEKLKKKNNNFNYFIYVEDLKPAENKNYIKGILPVNDIALEIIKNDKSKVFLSGPPVMINSFNEILKEKGFSENNIYFDKWE